MHFLNSIFLSVTISFFSLTSYAQTAKRTVSNDVVAMDQITIKDDVVKFGNISFYAGNRLGNVKSCEYVLSKIDLNSYFANKTIPSNNKAPVNVQSCGEQFNTIDNAYALCTKDKTLRPETIIGATIAYDECFEKVIKYESRTQICKTYALNFIKQRIEAEKYEKAPSATKPRSGRGVN